MRRRTRRDVPQSHTPSESARRAVPRTRLRVCIASMVGARRATPGARLAPPRDRAALRGARALAWNTDHEDYTRWARTCRALVMILDWYRLRLEYVRQCDS